jgi:uncharacterized protein YbjT (DUF2867 family)
VSKILVTGGTGTLGRAVVARLLAHHHLVRLLSHRASSAAPPGVEVYAGDLADGTGLAEAVAGMDAIIHCASNSREDRYQTDIEGTRALVQAASAHGKPHLVYISIVGIDRSTYAYYQAKYQAEQLIEQGHLPWTILRTTQFHDLVLRLLHSFGIDTRAEVSVPAGMRFQSIDHREVADRLVQLVEQKPSGHTPEMGGPQVLTIEEMAAAYLRLQGRKAIIRPEPMAGALFEVFRSGINLIPMHADGIITWEAFVAQGADSTKRPSAGL